MKTIRKKIMASAFTLLVMMSILTTSAFAAPVVTYKDGVKVTHYSEKQYNSGSTSWRAYAWTTATKSGTNRNHYTRARVVNTIIPAVIYKDSGRVNGYAKTIARTGYVAAREQGYSLRSYWGLN